MLHEYFHRYFAKKCMKTAIFPTWKYPAAYRTHSIFFVNHHNSRLPIASGPKKFYSLKIDYFVNVLTYFRNDKRVVGIPFNKIRLKSTILIAIASSNI